MFVFVCLRRLVVRGHCLKLLFNDQVARFEAPSKRTTVLSSTNKPGLMTVGRLQQLSTGKPKRLLLNDFILVW